MQCIACGTTLQTGMNACPKCGTPAAYSSLTLGDNNATPPAQEFGPFQETSSARPPSRPGGTSPTNPYGGLPPTMPPPTYGMQGYPVPSQPYPPNVQQSQPFQRIQPITPVPPI